MPRGHSVGNKCEHGAGKCKNTMIKAGQLRWPACDRKSEVCELILKVVWDGCMPVGTVDHMRDAFRTEQLYILRRPSATNIDDTLALRMLPYWIHAVVSRTISFRSQSEPLPQIVRFLVKIHNRDGGGTR